MLADAGYGEGTEFRDALEKRDLRYAVGIAPQVGVWIKPPKIKVPEYSGRGAPPKRKKWDYEDQRLFGRAAASSHGPGFDPFDIFFAIATCSFLITTTSIMAEDEGRALGL